MVEENENKMKPNLHKKNKIRIKNGSTTIVAAEKYLKWLINWKKRKKERHPMDIAIGM